MGKWSLLTTWSRGGSKYQNRFYMCKREEERITHLFLHFMFGSKVWGRILQKLEVNWVFNVEMGQLVNWQGPFTHPLVINLWKIIPPHVFWGIWKDQNNMVFKNEEREVKVGYVRNYLYRITYKWVY